MTGSTNVTANRAESLALYRTMVTIRLVEESFVPAIIDGTIRCPVHLYSGQEAIAAGVCHALRDTDYIFGSHRSHGHFLAKGGGIKELVAEVYCRETGCSRGRGGSMHLTDPDRGVLGSAPIVAGTIPLALGAALAAQIRRDRRVVVAFFGDGATGEGVLYEALNFAALRKLPIIFACENNLYSTHMPLREIRVDRPISTIAEPFGIATQTIDGNDVIAVYEAAHRAVAACRDAAGPSFMEFMTYRLRGHVGPDDNIQGAHTDIRPAREVAIWRARDPITRFESALLTAAGVTHQDLEDIRTAIAAQIEEAHSFARESPRPAPTELADYVFQT